MKLNHNLILSELREFMRMEKLDFFLVSATDEYLNEYVSLENNSRYFVSGFTGSTGDLLVTTEAAYLFVDGRYHKQADDEVYKTRITVVKLDMTQTQRSQIINIVKLSEALQPRFGLVSSKTGYSGFVLLSNGLKEGLENVKFVDYKYDPLNKIVPKEIKNIEPEQQEWSLRAVPHEISGLTADEKLDLIAEKLGDTDVFVVTKLEETAWLTNLRGDGIPFSTSFKSKAVIEDGKCTVFLDADSVKDVLKDESFSKYTFMPESEFERHIAGYTGKNLAIGFDQNSINLAIYKMLEKTRNRLIPLDLSPIAEMKAVKNQAELTHMGECFLKTDIVVSRTKTWLNQKLRDDLPVSEKDLYDKVNRLFKEEGAVGLSFNTISSIRENTAVIHYSHPDPAKFIKPGDIMLIDCGAYFEGGYATDITRTFLAGAGVAASSEQKKVFTAVLKGFLHGLNYRINPETTGFDIDKAVRDVVIEDAPEGFSFPHGTGHGVGISVHESPPRISLSESAKTPLKPGMCFTIEPGLYNYNSFGDNSFGVRLENTVAIIEKEGGLKIKSLAKSNFDVRLVDFDRLTEQEKIWFDDYQRKAID